MMILSGTNGDFDGHDYLDKSFKMLSSLNYSKEEYQRSRLTTPTLKTLQYFGYILRHVTILSLIVLFFKFRKV